MEGLWGSRPSQRHLAKRVTLSKRLSNLSFCSRACCNVHREAEWRRGRRTHNSVWKHPHAIPASSVYLCKTAMTHETQTWGRLEGKVHRLPIRIYYEDTDLSGVVYHANYLRFMERGRSEFFRCAGIARLAMIDADETTVWTLRRASLEFFRPARVDDLVEVHTRATSLSGARMSADQKIYRGHELLAHGTVEACVITLAGKPRRIPVDIRTKLLCLVSSPDA